jgi:hypothetical protein
MYEVIEFLVLGALTLLVFQWLYRKWKNIDLEEKEYVIKETEKNHAKIEGLKKNHPDFEKKRKEVEQFKK